MDNDILEKIKNVFERRQEIKLAYFFGSQVTGNAGPLSDFDFAFYVDGVDKKEAFEIKLFLANEIGKILKTDKIDVVCLNSVDNLELKYAIIRDGKLLVEQQPYKLIVEPRILNEYFDFHSMLERYNLTNG
ncbi:MAG: nucleotidyltransferase domain-containing protein [bacterium]